MARAAKRVSDLARRPGGWVSAYQQRNGLEGMELRRPRPSVASTLGPFLLGHAGEDRHNDSIASRGQSASRSSEPSRC